MNEAPSTAGAASPQGVPPPPLRLDRPDPSGQGPAWHQAHTLGPSAVRPLVVAMADADRETARAAKRGLWNLVDHSGRPGAGAERNAVLTELAAVLAGPPLPAPVVRELLWMLSTIGRSESIPLLAVRLSDPELREDARCALQRFPGPAATEALKQALHGTRGDFAYALADALRVRGEAVPDYPSRRMVPTRSTQVGRSA